MIIRKEKWVIKWDFSSLKDWKYRVSSVEEWRSKLQNDLYWGWYIPHILSSFDEKGIFITKEEIHEWLKEKLLSYRKKNKLTWSYKKYVWSTANLNKKEFVKFLWDVEKYIFREFEVVIPDHNFF